MTVILDNFLSVWIYWMIPSFLLGIVGFGVLLNVRWGNQKNKNKSLKIGIILFTQTFFTWIIMFVSMGILEERARQELKDFLSQSNLSIRFNGQLIEKINS